MIRFSRTVFFLVTILLAGTAGAQEYTVKGSIVDGKGKSVDAGNVILLDPKDSSLITGNMFMEGKFEIKGAKRETYILKVAALSYHEHYQLISNPSMQAVLDIGTIKVKAVSLKEVEVVATVPLLTNQGDRMVVNVENTLLSQSGTAMDVMEGSPGIMVGNEGNISVFGKGDAVIYIDGQIANPEILRSIPANEIKQVEIITKPSAMYDAQGRVVVNVITKKGALNGYQSELFTQQTFAKKYYSFYGGNVSYRKSKLSILARYSVTTGNRWSLEEYTRSFSSNGPQVEMLNSIEEWRRIKGAHYYGLGFRYYIDSMSTIGLMGTGSFARVTKETANTNLVTIGNVAEEIRTSTTGIANTDDSNLNLNYNRKLDTTGSVLQVQGAYSIYNRTNSSYIDEEIANSAGTLYSKKRNVGTNGINIFSAQADHTKAFKGSTRLETGIKYTNIFNESSVIFQRLGSNEQWVDDATINNGFNYDEKNAAAYAQFHYSKKKWDARVGVRSEMTDIYGFSKKLGQKVVDTTYINLFPNGYLGYSFTKDLKLSLDYSYRINRPSYQDLDPFINYIDSLSSIRGNPYLRPEYTHSISTSLVYLEAASVELSYSYTKGLMDMYVEKVGFGSNQFFGQTRNFDNGDELTAGIVLPYQDKKKIYTTYNAFGYMRKNYAYMEDANVINSADSWYAYSYHKLAIKDFAVDAMFNYFSGGAEGLFVANSFYSLRASAQYTMLDNKLTVRFVANDILSSAVQSASSRIPGFDLTFRDVSDSHFFRLAASYRFGRLKQKAIEESEINKEERDRIKN